MIVLLFIKKVVWNCVNSFHSGVQLRESYSGNMEGQTGSEQVHISNTGNGGMVGKHKQPEITGFCDFVIKAKRIMAGFRKVCSLNGMSNKLKEQRCKY